MEGRPRLACILVKRGESSAKDDDVGEQTASEDAGIFGEKTEDQSRHEAVHIVPTLGFTPFGVVLQQFDIEAVQAAGGPDVESVIADLPYGRDASKRQEEAETVGELLVNKATVSPFTKFSASKSRPSVARMNFAFGLAVAGLSFSVVSVLVTCPVSHVAM